MKLKEQFSMGKIPSLKNAHLLLYVALKLCCVRELGDACDAEQQEQQQQQQDGYQNMSKTDLMVKILQEILECEGSLDRLMVCLLLGCRAPGLASGWYSQTSSEDEKEQDLRLILDHARLVPGCIVREVVSAPLWSCGSSPVVVAALAEAPRLVLTLLQYGAGGTALNYYLYSKCYKNGVYLAIAYLLRKLRDHVKSGVVTVHYLEPSGQHDPCAVHVPQISHQPARGAYEDANVLARTTDLLTVSGENPITSCLRYLLRSVPHVPVKFLRDQVGDGCDVALLLPRQCCLEPASLAHLARTATRTHLRDKDLLPQVLHHLPIPLTLQQYLNLLRD
ncbi:uncharacterized protein [Panulirus ornatus]|uniref:uncharacterized protein n=1 Tax=Panulirus ornatus TaxID=150431 RepID=UPI003A842BBD